MFYSFIQQAETVFIPVKDLYLVTVAVMKHKHCVTELIEFEILLYNRRQAVYTFSHINICRGNVNRLYTKCWGKERAYKINLKNFQKK